MNAFQAAEKSGPSSELKTELDDLFKSQNKSAVADATVIPASGGQLVERKDGRASS